MSRTDSLKLPQNNFAILVKKYPIIIDGDFKVQLSRHLKAREAQEQMFELRALRFNRSAVYKTYLDFLRAGAKIIRSDTYRASTEFLNRFSGIEDVCAWSVISAAVELAQKATYRYRQETDGTSSGVEFPTSWPRVAYCCSSYSILSSIKDQPVQFWNFTPRETVLRWHISRINLLSRDYLELLAFESIPSLWEAEAIVAALKNFSEVRAWITFSCSAEGELPDETNFAETATKIYDSLPKQIIAIGADQASSDAMMLLMQSINVQRDSKIPFILYLDKLPPTEDSNTSDATTQHNFLQKCINAGVRYISGCSNTSANNIKRICEQIENCRSQIRHQLRSPDSSGTTDDQIEEHSEE